jgi:CHAT domain-containing protein/tetratricopeptide (TPR) repeat protein
MNRVIAMISTASMALLAASSPATASESVAALDSFRVGDKGVLCTAQSRSADPRFATMFDRAYDIVCRDAAAPVGRIFALKSGKSNAKARFDRGLGSALSCAAPVAADVPALLAATKTSCTSTDTGLNHTIYAIQRGDRYFAVEGLSAYESALQLGLASVAADKQVAGEISVATTNAGDPAAFARVQVASLDPEQALAAGYGRNAEGSFAEASEFFEALVNRSRLNETGAAKQSEYLANQAMQQSNLGNTAEADRLFGEAAKTADGSNPLFGRLYRNLRAMHLLNNRRVDDALEQLQSKVPVVGEIADRRERLAAGQIDRRLAQRLAIDDDAMTRLGGGSSRLTEAERGTLLDAQADYLKGVALRLKGDKLGSKAMLAQSMQTFGSVRGGQVRSMAWMLASAATELSLIAESEGKPEEAKVLLRSALTTYAAEYPESATMLTAKARLAGMQARSGEEQLAIMTFRQLVADASRIPGGSDALRTLIKPYFDALVKEGGTSSAGDFFTASQAMVRPGVAQTQAVLARELSGGSDEASGLFRQSVNLTREIVATEVEINRLSALDARTPTETASLSAALDARKRAVAEQTGLISKLSAFPKFRVMSNASLSLADLQKALAPGEAYYKMLIVGEATYSIFAQNDAVKFFKIGASRSELEALTNTIRDSIVKDVDGQTITNVFDLEASYKMYSLLFAGLGEDLAAVKHLIYEPDGPLLKLPANVLVTDKAGILAYAERQKDENPDAFDFTGVSWLGRDRMVSTAVSAQSFVDVRRIAPSKAKRRYLGYGQNTPVERLAYAPKSEEGRDPCDWGLGLWGNPIKSAELKLGAAMLGGQGNEVIIEEAYSDTALRERTDLKDFRILQFATHGLVTAPKPGCPARPALVTSFGTHDSDGLLSFKEIFDLKLDADTIILSACDTAGAATAAATREAGITTGGNFALDGLVRAFVGAGARAVIASHWPIPDDYDATKKLMSGLYEGGTKVSVGESMRRAQNRLMDDPLTSHPYYWGAFSIVGDAVKPLTSEDGAQVASAATPQS